MPQSANSTKPSATRLSDWWIKSTQGRKGLLIWIIPAFLTRLAVLQTILPFFVDRVLQYVDPGVLAVAAVVSNPWGISGAKLALSISAWAGLVALLRDTWYFGGQWTPLVSPQSGEAYAVVNGACSPIGREMALLLFLEGYSLVLIDHADTDGVNCEEESLRSLKRDIEFRVSAGRTSAGAGDYSGRNSQQKILVAGMNPYSSRSVESIERTLNKRGVTELIDIYSTAHPAPLLFGARSGAMPPRQNNKIKNSSRRKPSCKQISARSVVW